MHQKRKIKNLILNRALQTRFALQIGLAGLLFFSVFSVIFTWKFYDLKSQLSQIQNTPDPVYYKVLDQFLQLYFISLSSLVFAVVLISGGSVVLSHRIAGPVFVIREFIQQLKEGNYATRRHLRPNDELKDVVSDLNSLAESLSTRKS